MAAKRKVNNLLGLAVLAVLVGRPMHRYEIVTTMRERGKDRDMDVKWGSLYTVVNNLEKAGYLEIVGSERDGARPERTIYTITKAGQDELADWTRELIADPTPEHHRFTAGLSVMSALSPDEVVELLGRRGEALDQAITQARKELDDIAATGLPRLFVVEGEYELTMLEAEAAWTRALQQELTGGDFPGLDLWRQVHQDGLDPAEAVAVFEGRSAPQ